MILHIPHSSTTISNLVTFYTRPEENLFYLTDILTDEIFCAGKGEPIIFPFSRFVCDVERLIDDPQEAQGRGILYRKDIFGNNIYRRITDEDAMSLYTDHHSRLNRAVAKSLTLLPKCIVVDCHSFPGDVARDVDICIGVNGETVPKDLLYLIYEYFIWFGGFGLRIMFNRPFEGAIVPSNYIDDPNVISIMLEINKDMYLYSDEKLDRVKHIISGALDIIYDYEYNSE